MFGSTYSLYLNPVRLAISNVLGMKHPVRCLVYDGAGILVKRPIGMGDEIITPEIYLAYTMYISPAAV